MLRTIIKVDKDNQTLKLPDHFIGKEVEVIAFIIDEIEPVHTAQNTVIENLTDAFNDVKLHEAGKKTLKSAKDLLDEL